LEAVSDVEGQLTLASADFIDLPNTLRKVEQEKQTPNITLEIDLQTQTSNTTLENVLETQPSNGKLETDLVAEACHCLSTTAVLIGGLLTT
jgi:hypothetical protein